MLKKGLNGKRVILLFVSSIVVSILFIFNVYAQVTNRTTTVGYTTISNAISNASPGDLIEADVGTYYEALRFTVSGITLRATAWTQANDNTNTIIDSSGRSNAVIFYSITNIVLQGFTIQNATNDGISINGSVGIEIRNCNVISNDDRGIIIEQTPVSTNILIHSNIVAHNDGAGIRITANALKLGVISGNIVYSNKYDGIYCYSANCRFTNNRIFGNGTGVDERADGNEWVDNIIYGNTGEGVILYEIVGGYLSGNEIYNNSDGIYFFKSKNVTVTNNIICSNSSGSGIRATANDCPNNVIVDNEIYNNESGIRFISNLDIIIERNVIYNSDTGIYVSGLSNSKIKLNTVKRSTDAGIIVSGTRIPAFTNNNIFSNTINFSNETALLIIVTNHWWGTTIESEINAKINSGSGGCNASNYRLFGEFDIALNAKTDRFPPVSWVQASSNSSPYGINIIWNKIAGAARYLLYRSKEPGISNLSSINIRTQLSGEDSTNFIDQNISFQTQYYYHVTSVDDHPIYTNESWYSGEAGIPPAVPGNFNASSVPGDYECVEITWDDYETETSYTLYRGTSILTTNALTSIAMDTSSYTDCTVNTNTKYYYWIRAVNKYGPSWYSVVSSNKTPSITVPDAPSWIDISLGETGLVIGWENVTNETSYTLYISTNNFDTTNEVEPFSKNVTNYNYGYPVSAKYYVKVKAHNIVGDSASSPVDSYIVNFRVFNRTQGWSYTNILMAISNVTPNDLIEADIYTYYEAVIIEVSGITLRATAWTQNNDNTNTIISPGTTNGIEIISASNVVIQGFMINNYTKNYDGVIINDAKGLELRNCIILSNNRGVVFKNTVLANDILIHSNYIAHSKNAGILVGSVNGNALCTVSSNTICSNGGDGIYCRQNNIVFIGNRIYNNDDGIKLRAANDTVISGNDIFNNTEYGIEYYTDSSSGTIITNNNIYSNVDNGIHIGNSLGNNSRIVDNDIFEHPNGINANINTGVVIKWNNIYDTSAAGIDAADLTDGLIELNTVKQSGTGIIISGTDVPVIINNNILSNTVNLSNQTAALITMTNNWWNTTILSNIEKTIAGGTGGYDVSRYRLFGEFDIAVGADTERMPVIPWAWTYSNSSPFGMGVRWGIPSNTNDFFRYTVYKSKEPGTSNLSAANILTQFYDSKATNFVDVKVGLYTQYYYHITSLDKNPVYTNESWYSPQARGSMPVTMPELYIIKSVEELTLDGTSGLGALPGSTIKYKIFCSNTGNWQAENVILYDRIVAYVKFASNSATNIEPGWTNEWSTNTNPDQYWGGGGYTNVEPASNIKWIRWRKLSLGIEESGTLYFKVIIK